MNETKPLPKIDVGDTVIFRTDMLVGEKYGPIYCQPIMKDFLGKPLVVRENNSYGLGFIQVEGLESSFSLEMVAEVIKPTNELEKELVLYPEAIELKELGFNKPCFGYYTSPNGLLIEQPIGKNGDFVYYAPTYSQAFRWFREKYKYEVSIHKLIEEDGYMVSIYWVGVEGIAEQVEGYTYEEAELACLRKLIEIVKK